VNTDEYFETALVLGLMVLGMLSLQLVSALFGPQAGAVAYLLVTVGGLMLVNLSAQLIASSYPYIRLIVRPHNVTLHLFVDRDLSYGRHLGNGFYETHLKLKYPVKYLDYGKTQEIVVLHRGKLSDHLHFRPGTAVWRGIYVKHPVTEILEVVQAPTASTYIDHGTPIPVFHLLLGSKSFPQVLHGVRHSCGDETVRQLEERVRQLEMENAWLRREALEYHQRALALEEVNVQKTAETAGLLEAKIGIKEHAVELMLGLVNAFGRFDKAVEALTGRRTRIHFNRWLAVTVLGALAIAYLWLNPDALRYAVQLLSNPLVAVALAAVLIAAVYYGTVGRKRR